MKIGLRALRMPTMIAMALVLSASVQADSLTVKTEQGSVHGKTINEGKVKAFLGLPYAAPPVGDLRWKAPQPPAPWKGDRDATHFGAHCAQNPIFDDMMFQDSGPSEDCLFLNVYAPAASSQKSRLPVMVWIHGGAFLAGSSSEPRHNGEFLPLKGVILVTINYRLGVFGFLATADLAKEANGAAGNYGLMDMVAALLWVKANIRQFGGDPANVTLFGESAGSYAVSVLMASPLARGLFQKAFGESGSAFGAQYLSKDLQTMRQQRRDGRWVDSLGVRSLAELRALPTEAILQAVKSGNWYFESGIDGKVLTEPIQVTYAAGRQAHVPLLAGWNRDEIASRASSMTAEKWKASSTANFGARTEEFLKFYPGDTDVQARRSAIDYDSDWQPVAPLASIGVSTWEWLEKHRMTGKSPVYCYRMELPAPPSKYHSGSFAFHSDEIEYVFGTLDTRPGAVWRPEDRKLSEQMMSYWTNFAKTGDPNGAGLPHWPRYGENREMIHLDSTVTAGPDAEPSRYEFMLRTMPIDRAYRPGL